LKTVISVLETDLIELSDAPLPFRISTVVSFFASIGEQLLSKQAGEL
jgi:hypothetical protein